MLLMVMMVSFSDCLGEGFYPGWVRSSSGTACRRGYFVTGHVFLQVSQNLTQGRQKGSQTDNSPTGTGGFIFLHPCRAGPYSPVLRGSQRNRDALHPALLQ